MIVGDHWIGNCIRFRFAGRHRDWLVHFSWNLLFEDILIRDLRAAFTSLYLFQGAFFERRTYSWIPGWIPDWFLFFDKWFLRTSWKVEKIIKITKWFVFKCIFVGIKVHFETHPSCQFIIPSFFSINNEMDFNSHQYTARIFTHII